MQIERAINNLRGSLTWPSKQRATGCASGGTIITTTATERVNSTSRRKQRDWRLLCVCRWFSIRSLEAEQASKRNTHNKLCVRAKAKVEGEEEAAAAKKEEDLLSDCVSAAPVALCSLCSLSIRCEHSTKRANCY